MILLPLPMLFWQRHHPKLHHFGWGILERGPIFPAERIGFVATSCDQNTSNETASENERCFHQRPLAVLGLHQTLFLEVDAANRVQS